MVLKRPSALMQTSRNRTSRLTLTVVAVCIVTFVGCDERRTSHSVDIAAARSSGVIDRGWVPRVLPESATNIEETHDLDTNAVWGTFDFPIAEQSGWRASFVETNLSGKTVSPAAQVQWPAFLTGTVSQENVRRAGYESYLADDGTVFVINGNQGHAYFWRPPR